MLEWLSPSLIYGPAKDIWHFLRHRKLSPAGKLALREKWKEPFSTYLRDCWANKLRQDIIIRDVKRMDQYPDLADRPGISPWFRLGLVGQYHRGIEVSLCISALIFEDSEKSWRKADYRTELDKSINAYLIGYIRYEDIISVDWGGDEYYGYPHLYCQFGHSGQPYEKLSYCEMQSLGPGQDFFVEIQSEKEVRLTSLKFGTDMYR
jgi:hypothetical protein